jgi:hypothetical protein
MRGEQFWLDKTRAAQLRPRGRAPPSHPALCCAAASPARLPGRRQPAPDILARRCPNLHEAFEWPRVQTLHFYGSFWPHNSGFNKLNVEANLPDTVYNDLR